jgi:hypothetical protein
MHLFYFRGEVVIPGDRLSDVCAASHALGIHGLTDFLPNSRTSDVYQQEIT